MTTRTLYLMRHADAVATAPSGRDYDRPLSALGVRQAGEVGVALSARGVRPAVVLHSSAVRAAQTAAVVAETLGVMSLRAYSRLYNATVADLLQLLGETSPLIFEVLVVGHNPTVSDALDVLCREIHPFGTAGMACITFDDCPDWQDLTDGVADWRLAPGAF